MNISQLFVTKRPISWTAMISVLIWGVYAYVMMPQRQDPIIPVVTGVIITPYPGAEAEKVEQDVRGKLGEIKDLPVAAGRPTQSLLNKDFGDSVAVMLTISSPPVSDLEIKLRASSIREAIETHR